MNFLKKLIFFFKKLNYESISKEIDSIINFDRKFDKWDTIIKAIVLISISELRNSDKEKVKIILNDYINISKYFVTIKETKLINSILLTPKFQKIINSFFVSYFVIV